MVRLGGLESGFKRFLFSGAAYFIGNSMTAAIPLLFLPILTRWLSPKDYGLIATFNAIRTNVEPAVGMSTAGAICRAHTDRNREGFDFPCYIFNAILVNLSLFILVAILLFFLQDIVTKKLHFPSLWLWLVALVALCSSLGGYKADLWIYQDRPISYGSIQIMRSVFNFGLSFGVLCLVWMDWRGRISGILLAELIFCFSSLFLLLRQDGLRFHIKKKYIKDVVAFGFPLYPHSLGWMMIGVADRFFLNALLGLETLGVYNVGYAFASVIIMLATPFDLAASPYIYEMLDKDDRSRKERFVCCFALYFMLFLFLAFVLATFGIRILDVIVGEKFRGASQFVFWLAMSQVPFAMYRIVSKFITFSKKTYLLAWMTFISGLVAVPANYFLIKLNGAIGAAQATFVAYTTSFLLTLWLAHRLYPMPWLAIFRRGTWRGLFIGLYSHVNV